MTPLHRLNFKEFELLDQDILKPILSGYDRICLSGYTFASLMSWSHVYHYKWAVIGGRSLLITTAPKNDYHKHFLQPKGLFSEHCQTEFINHLKSLDYTAKIYGVCPLFLEKHADFSSHFDIIDDPGLYNYIYRTKDLAFLQGRDYQPKRNLINQAEKLYKYTTEAITKTNISDVKNILSEIEKDILEEDINLLNEKIVLQYTLDNYSDLKQQGLLIRIEGKPTAFSIYEKLNQDTAVIHFEKALRSYKGLYQLINRETAKEIHTKGYEFINREEDLNIAGLRKAKLSYCPVNLCKTSILVLKNNDDKK